MRLRESKKILSGSVYLQTTRLAIFALLIVSIGVMSGCDLGNSFQLLTESPFVAQPLPIDESTVTQSVELSVVSNEDATLFWVLYADDGFSGGNEALIADATGAGGVQRGANINVIAGIPFAIPITELNPDTPYDFFAALQNSSGESWLSDKIEILTAPLPAFSAQPAVTTTSPTTTTIAYTVNRDAAVYWVVYADGDTLPTDDAALIADVQAGAGVARSDMLGDGTVADAEQTITVSELIVDSMYNFYAAVVDSESNSALATPLMFSTAGDVAFTAQPSNLTAPTTTTAEITLTPNVNSTLFWVLYTDGGFSGDAAALIADAQATGGEQRGADIVATGGDATTVSISGLTLNTAYDFYAVLQDSDGNTILSAKLDVDTAASTVPTFTAQPSLTTNNPTNIVVSLTVDTTTVHWVLYDGADPAPVDATALVTDAQGAGGLQRSGATGLTVTANTPIPITLLSLNPATAYTFYAVADDGAGMLSLLSTALAIITAALPSFDAEPTNLTAPTTTTAEVTLTPNVNSTLFWVLYTDGGFTGNALTLLTDALGAGGEQRGADIAATGGAAAIIPISGLTPNTSYDFYAALRDADNNTVLSAKLDVDTAASTVPTFTTQPSLTTNNPTNITVSLTVDTTTVHWVLYDGADPAPVDATALVTDAQGAGGLQRSGATGLTVTANTPATIMISGLSTATSYNFYAVAEDGAGMLSLLSTALAITTAALPSFDAEPSNLTAPTTTTAEITLTPNVNSTLFWVLYTDGGFSGNAAALIADAQATGGEKRGADIAATGGAAATVSISGLTINTAYDFYAVLRDADNNTVLSAKLDVDTPAVTAPTFTTQPSLTANNPTNITVSLTVDTTTVHWVLYNSADPAPANATALVTDAQGAGGVQRSGATGLTVTANTPATIMISGLSAATSYNFYAVADDGAGTLSLLSTVLAITTVALPSFDAEPSNLTAPTTTTAEITLTPNVNSTLFWVLYTDGGFSGDAAALIADAQATGGEKRGADIAATGGAAATISISGLIASTSYDFYAVLRDPDGNTILSTKLDVDTAAVTAPTFTTQPSLTANNPTNITVSLTVDTTTVHWVLYNSADPAPADASALVADAQGAGGVQRSGATGLTVTANTPATIAISGLSAATSYNFYAVADDGAGTFSLLSTVLAVTTANLPSFTAQPSNLTAPTQTTAEITLTPNVNTTLFWVLYTDGGFSGDAAALIADAQATGGEKRGADIAATGGAAATIPISGLTASTSYDFYAVLRDSDGNTILSTKLDVDTAAVTAPTFTTQPSLTANNPTNITVSLTVDTTTVHWVLYNSADPAPADASALVTDAQGAGGVQRSGATGLTVTANTPATIAISGLSAATSYTFYAVADSGGGNISDLSTVLAITTAELPSFTAQPSNLTAPTDTTAEITLTPNVNSTLFWVLYPNNGFLGYSATLLITHAQGTGGEQRGADIAVTGGAATTISISGLTANTSYDFFAVLQDPDGNNVISPKLDVDTALPVGVPIFVAQPSLTTSNTTNVTVSLTVDTTTVHWVLYNSADPAPANATALVTDAQGAGGVQRSGATGLTVTANTPATIMISGLSAATSYNFYAVADDGGGNISILSTVLAITTANLPSFTAQPSNLTTPTQTTAEITLTPNVNSTLFWVLYTDGGFSGDAAALIADAEGAGGLQRGADIAATGGAAATIPISGLTASTAYDFYAVLRDPDGNTVLSSGLDFNTLSPPPTFVGAPTIFTPNTQTESEIYIVPAADATLFWVLYTDGGFSGDAAALIADAEGTGGLQRATNIAVMAADAVVVNLTGLTAGTSYDFYAALRNAEGSATLSSKLDVDTAP